MLLLVGEESERLTLENYVEKNNLNKKVKFINFLTQEELKIIYQNAALFILPSSHSETWGLVVNEAMAAGIPVMVSNKVGCATTLVKDGVNGYIFDINSEKSLEEKLLKFIKLTKVEKQQMSHKSLEFINQWDLNRFSNGLKDAINYLEKKKSKKRNLLGSFISKFWYGRYNSI